MSGLRGYISQIIGPVVDVHFDIRENQTEQLPSIYEALSITRSDGRQLIVEVQQHIGEVLLQWTAPTASEEAWRLLQQDLR